MEILFEDKHIIVALKPADIVSENQGNGQGFADLLAAHTNGYIGTVHRLDRGVGGVMVYAKTKSAAAELSEQMRTHTFQKEYLAMVYGIPTPAQERWTDLLFHDRFANKTYVVDRKRGGVKEAILDYCVQETAVIDESTVSLVRIALQTGRTHQIRVQFSHRKHPLMGDRKYGAPKSGPIGLFCARLDFLHPVTKQPLSYSALPMGEQWGHFPSLNGTKENP